MKNRDELQLPQDLAYTDEHVWVKREADGACTLGISDYAQDQLGEVVYVDLPEAGTHYDSGKEFGSVESVKSVNALYMPVSGTIIECNTALEADPSAVNTDCYGSGWMARIKPDANADTALLKDAHKYRAGLR